VGRYLDWYLVEVERELPKDLQMEARHELLALAEDHILTIREELMEMGMDESSAERSAVGRFGEPASMLPPKVRLDTPVSGWLAPMLLIVISMFALAAAISMGGQVSLLIAAGLCGFGLFLSALMCFRRGRLPSLVFVGTLLVGFTLVSTFASTEFVGYRTGILRTNHIAQAQQWLKDAEADARMRAGVFQAGEQFVAMNNPSKVPDGLRVNGGILYPPDGDRALFRTDAPSDFLDGQTLVATIHPGEPLATAPDASVALREWQRMTPSGYEMYWETQGRLRTIDEIRPGLENPRAVADEILFGGIAVGSTVTLFWFLLAWSLNFLANLGVQPWRRSLPPRRIVG
jgi:hypothetical protein